MDSGGDKGDGILTEQIITQVVKAKDISMKIENYYNLHTCRRTIRVHDQVPSTIAEDEEESHSPSVPVVRTKSTIDPDGFEFRDV